MAARRNRKTTDRKKNQGRTKSGMRSRRTNASRETSRSQREHQNPSNLEHKTRRYSPTALIEESGSDTELNENAELGSQPREEVEDEEEVLPE